MLHINYYSITIGIPLLLLSLFGFILVDYTKEKNSCKMTKSMLVSIIILAYNTELYIGRCLDSVCSKTYKDVEVIVVNYASTDGTLQILEKYAETDSCVRILNQSTKKGNGIGCNTAIKAAKGEYIMFVKNVEL